MQAQRLLPADENTRYSAGGDFWDLHTDQIPVLGGGGDRIIRSKAPTTIESLRTSFN